MKLSFVCVALSLVVWCAVANEVACVDQSKVSFEQRQVLEKIKQDRIAVENKRHDEERIAREIERKKQEAAEIQGFVAQCNEFINILSRLKPEEQAVLLQKNDPCFKR